MQATTKVLNAYEFKQQLVKVIRNLYQISNIYIPEEITNLFCVSHYKSGSKTLMKDIINHRRYMEAAYINDSDKFTNEILYINHDLYNLSREERIQYIITTDLNYEDFLKVGEHGRHDLYYRQEFEYDDEQITSSGSKLLRTTDYLRSIDEEFIDYINDIGRSEADDDEFVLSDSDTDTNTNTVLDLDSELAHRLFTDNEIEFIRIQRSQRFLESDEAIHIFTLEQITLLRENVRQQYLLYFNRVHNLQIDDLFEQ